MVYAVIPATQEAEAGGSTSLQWLWALRSEETRPEPHNQEEAEASIYAAVWTDSLGTQ
jgi:hypothetical protein